MKSLLLLMSLAACNGLLEDTRPKCIKIDDCSCRLKNVQDPGLINLHSLVSDNQEPRFVTEAKPEKFTFYYNPCSSFFDLVCPNSSVCQKVELYDFYDLGNLHTAEFEYQNNSVVVVYKSGVQNPDGYNRTSEVELICDESEILGRFEYVGEPTLRHYRFKLYTQCACPGKCKASTKECVGQDLCTCEMSDGSGMINLHSLDNPLNPMKDEPNPKQTIFYNPCSPVADPQCSDHSVCEMQGDSIVGLGHANTAKFVYNRRSGLGIKYLGNISSTVNLICDHSLRDVSLFRPDKTANTYNIYSVCACPDGCDSPALPTPPPPTQIDSCTCKSNSDNAVINLHELDNPHAPLKAKDNRDYTYYYNPCSGLNLQIVENGKCDGVSACQEDPYSGSYFNMGQIDPIISYNATVKEFTFHYTKGDGDRSFDVRMVCDPKADTPILTTDDDIPYGVYFYPLKLTTKLACF